MLSVLFNRNILIFHNNDPGVTQALPGSPFQLATYTTSLYRKPESYSHGKNIPDVNDIFK
jgi:hypothetical protein